MLKKIWLVIGLLLVCSSVSMANDEQVLVTIDSSVVLKAERSLSNCQTLQDSLEVLLGYYNPGIMRGEDRKLFLESIYYQIKLRRAVAHLERLKAERDMVVKKLERLKTMLDKNKPNGISVKKDEN